MDADFLLIHKMKNGDEEAIEVFVKKYYSTIRNYCRLHTYTDCDAEDITQATFEHFFRSFRSYHHLGKTANYLYVIARNLCRDSYKKKRDIVMEALPDKGENPIAVIENKIDIEESIKKLPEDLQEVVILHYDEKLHAYAKNQKYRNIYEKKLQQTIIKSKEAYWDGEIERNMSWLEFLYQQASYIQKHWWFAQGAVLLILWMTMFLSDSSIYTRRCMGILAPSFVILILPELWKNRSNGAMEVEGATFFSIKKIYAARMLLFGMVDVCLLSVFLITSTFVLQIAFMDILIQFILPMNVTCCICFRLLCSKGDDYVSSTLFSCLIWIAVWTLVVLKDSIYEHISTSIWCGMMILSVLYLCYSIWRVWKCSERYYESNGASV